MTERPRSVKGTFSPSGVQDVNVAQVGGTPVTSPLPVSVANGADVAEGATTDAAVVTDANGTVSGKLRGLVKWAFERMPAALGGTTAAASLPVALASDGTFATLTGGVTETAPATDTASSGLNGRLQRIAQRITSLIAQIPAALGQGTMAQSLSVAIASNQSAIPVTVSSTTVAVTTTNTKSNVSGSASSVTILAANANRVSGAVTNDSAAILYLDESGGTASSTSYTVLLQPGDFYSFPQPIYRGAITGIWASATGAARVVEGV